MQIVYDILASMAAIAVTAAALRALLLMRRLEQTRHELTVLIAESVVSLRQATHLFASLQESAERVHRGMDRIETVTAYLHPATAVSGILAGARRLFTGSRQPVTPSAAAEKEIYHG